MQEVGFYLAGALFAIMILGILIIFPLWIILTICTPKSLLDKYFKEPHFTLGETIMMAQYPGSFMRTALFSWLLLLQPFGFKTKRNISNLDDCIPRWYALALRFLASYVAFTIVSMITLFAVLFGIKYYAGL